MKYLKFIWQAYPWAILICLLALLLDLTGFGDSPTQRAIWFVPTFAVCLYWIGITLLIRFKIAKRAINLAITWAIIIPMYVIAIGALTLVTNNFEETGGAPALVSLLAAIWGFQTLRAREAAN